MSTTRKSKLYTVIALTALLAACGAKPQVIEYQSIDVNRPVLTVPEVDTFSALPIEWVIVTPENVDTIFNDIRGATVLFALSPEDYENLSINTQGMLTLIAQLNSQLSGYKLYYIDSENEFSDITE